jgi:hypothetical protein
VVASVRCPRSDWTSSRLAPVTRRSFAALQGRASRTDGRRRQGMPRSRSTRGPAARGSGPAPLVRAVHVGQPACTGQGEGQTTCVPPPVMIWTSHDGSSWTRIADTSMLAGATIQAITADLRGLVAIGDTGWDKPAIWISATGTRWQRLALPSNVFADARFSDVRAKASGYVLGGGTGAQSISVTGGPKENAPTGPSSWRTDSSSSAIPARPCRCLCGMWPRCRRLRSSRLPCHRCPWGCPTGQSLPSR